MYDKNTIQSEIIGSSDQDSSEMLVVKVFNDEMPPLTIVSLYRPNHVNMTSLKNTLQLVLNKCQTKGGLCLLIGDFNIDFLQKRDSVVSKFCSERQFRQIISGATHVSGSLLDHIYINNEIIHYFSGIIPTYYSDHDAIYCCIPTKPNSVPSGKHISINDEEKDDDVIAKSHDEKRVYKSTVNPKRKTKKTTKRSQTNKNVSSHINIQENVSIIDENYNPLSVRELNTTSFLKRKEIAQKLHLDIRSDEIRNPALYDLRYIDIIRNLQSVTQNVTIDATEPDGNCFFRAISKEILGSEDYHRLIRIIICDFLLNHQQTFQTWLENGANQYQHHIELMRKNRTWATELEILAASTIFNCDLYIFTNSYIQNRNQGWKWIKFPPQEIHNTDIAYHLDGNIYLHHTWGNHYDRVVSAISLY